MSKPKNKPQRAAQQATPNASAPKKTARRQIAQPAMMALLFLGIWAWSAIYYAPVWRICREYSFWVANPEQMKFVLDLQGGWLWYVGRMLLQLFCHPWLGGLLLAAAITSSTWVLGAALRLNPRWRWAQYLPAFLYLGWASYEGLDLFFEAETGRILGPLMLVVLAVLLCGGTLCIVRALHRRNAWNPEESRPANAGWRLNGPSWMELAVLVVGFAAVIGYNQWQRPYTRVISQMMIAQYDQDWNRIQKLAREHATMSNRPMAAYYAIALVHTDQICDLRQQLYPLLLHELKCQRQTVHCEDQKDMDQHIAHSGRHPFPVYDLIIQYLIAQKQCCNNQKRHQGKINGTGCQCALKVGSGHDDHFPKGKHHVQHRPLRQMPEIDHGRLLLIRKEAVHADPVRNGKK